MKVLMILFKDVLYDARVKREAQSLANAGFSVTLFCVKEYEENITTLPEGVEVHRLTISTKSAKKLVSKPSNKNYESNEHSFKKAIVRLIRTPIIKIVKDVYAYYEFYTKIAKAIEGKTFDVIHCHDLNTLWQGTMLKKKLGIKLIYDSHEIFAEMAGRKELDKRFCYWLEKKSFKHIDHLITVNPFLRDYLLNLYQKKESTIIQNVPNSPIESGRTLVENYWRSKYHLNHSNIILLYQGGFTQQRGIEESILSLKALPKEFVLILLGQGSLKDTLKELVKINNLGNRVFFHEQVASEDLHLYTRQADIGLVIYRNTSKNNYYSTPNKIFEYMQAELPIISSDHPGKSYIVNNEKIGMCVEETPTAIAEGVGIVSRNLSLYKENCKIATTHWKWENEEKKLIQLYGML